MTKKRPAALPRKGSASLLETALSFTETLPLKDPDQDLSDNLELLEALRAGRVSTAAACKAVNITSRSITAWRTRILARAWAAGLLEVKRK